MARVRAAYHKAISRGYPEKVRGAALSLSDRRWCRARDSLPFLDVLLPSRSLLGPRVEAVPFLALQLPFCRNADAFAVPFLALPLPNSAERLTHLPLRCCSGGRTRSSVRCVRDCFPPALPPSHCLSLTFPLPFHRPYPAAPRPFTALP